MLFWGCEQIRFSMKNVFCGMLTLLPNAWKPKYGSSAICLHRSIQPPTHCHKFFAAPLKRNRYCRQSSELSRCCIFHPVEINQLFVGLHCWLRRHGEAAEDPLHRVLRQEPDERWPGVPRACSSHTQVSGGSICIYMYAADQNPPALS